MGKPSREATNPFASYVRSIGASALSEKTEHTDRGAIADLLGHFAPKGITIVPEPKQVARSAPDFKIRQNGQIIGYVEAKPIGTGLEGLRKIIKGEQINRYRSLSENLIVTDYLNWIWLRNGQEQHYKLCEVDDVYRRSIHLEQSKIEGVSAVLRASYRRHLSASDALRI